MKAEAIYMMLQVQQRTAESFQSKSPYTNIQGSKTATPQIWGSVLQNADEENAKKTHADPRFIN